MAQGIQSWKQTGIPINEQSIGKISGGMAKFGMGGIRGGAMARGFMGAGQRIAGGGPQGGVDIMALRHLGGYTGEGGLSGYVDAAQRLEEGEYGMEEIQNLFRAATQAGAGKGPGGKQQQAAGMLTFRKTMAGLGVQMGFREVKLLQAQMRGETLEPDQQAQLDKVMGLKSRGEKTAGRLGKKGLEGLAGEGVPAALRRQANIANMQLASGQKVLSAVQDMEAATTKVNLAFTTTLQPALDSFSQFTLGAAGNVLEFSNQLKEATTMAQKFATISGWVTGI